MKLPKIKITMTRNSLFTAVLIAVLALGTTLPSSHLLFLLVEQELL